MTSRFGRILAVFATAAVPSVMHAALFSTAPRHEPDRPRGLIFPPLASLLLPSLDQWIEGQAGSAAVYLGVAGAGAAMAGNAVPREVRSKPFEDYSDRERQFALGSQLYLAAGELSAFQSFRTAVESRRSRAEFPFLPAKPETTSDLISAPFAFEEILRPTTFIPLLTLLGIEIVDSRQRGRRHLSDNKSFFVLTTSYNAGVGEEAFFRGYLMPLFRERWRNDFWSNTTTAILFGAAHLSNYNRFPIAQAALGWYFGWRTQRDGWSLRQAIFLHAWWDVIALGFEIASNRNSRTPARLPLFSFSF